VEKSLGSIINTVYYLTNKQIVYSFSFLMIFWLEFDLFSNRISIETKIKL
jgi:hypothetical protein